MTIKFRLALLTALVLAVAVGISSTLIVWRVRRQLQMIASETVIGQASHVANLIRPALASGNLAQLDRIAVQFTGKDTVAVGIANKKGVVVADSDGDDVGKVLPSGMAALSTGKPVVGPIGATTRGAVPVVDRAGRKLGSVIVTIDTRREFNLTNYMLNTASAIWMLAILVALGLSYLVVTYLMAPLPTLLSAIRRISHGDLNSRAPLPSSPELCEIAEAFNEMAFAVNRRIRNLEILNQMAAEISTMRRLRDICGAVRSTCALVLGADAMLWVFDEYGENLTTVATLGTQERITGGGSCTVTVAAREARTIIIGPGEADLPPGTRIASALPPASAAIIVPLTVPGGVVGALSAEAALGQTAMTREQVSLLTAIANVTGPAVAALLRTESQARSARMLQSILVPRQPLKVPGVEAAAWYRPAAEIGKMGGDYYDFIPLPNGEWCFVIGDVSGKGLQAAQYTTMAKYVFRSYVLEYQSPSRAVELTNAALIVQMGSEAFITLFCCALHAETGRLRAARAGHPPPFICSSETGAVRQIDVPGPPAGLFEDATYSETEEVLKSGDMLAMFTDGVTEAHTGPEMYGEQRLQKTLERCIGLRAQETVAAIVEDVELFSGGKLKDDAAILILRIE